MWGCDLSKIEAQWGADRAQEVREKSVEFIEKGRMIEKDRKLILTNEGKLFADGIAGDLFADQLT
jgi:oxygen-independent coproporphyrinogen-3 oxidase